MRIKQLVVTISGVVLITAAAFAKDQPAEQPMDQQAMMEQYMKLATPGEPHKLFASLAGSWTGAIFSRHGRAK